MNHPSSGSAEEPPVIETQYVTVDGTRLYCRIVGEGPPLVFVHAGIADSRLWQRQLDAFADQFRVIAYDLRGYGNSAIPSESFAHYRDLGRLLDVLDVESAHVVGSSMGGATAIDLALDQPNRVASLTLVAPAIGGYEFADEETIAGWADATDAFEAGNFERAATIESEIWLAGPTRSLDDVDPICRDLVRSMLLRSYELDTDDATEETLQPPAIDRLDELAVPVLLVVGELDTPDMRSIAELLERELSDVTVEIIAGAAHLPSLERPDEFDGILRSFLGGASEAEF